MTKLFLFALTLLFPAALLQSQDTSQTGSASSSQGTVEGCLEGSDGNYTLTDKFGRTYQLGGETSTPAAYVGREVQITTSTPTSIAITSNAGAEEAGMQQPTLAVDHVKYLSGTCHSGVR